MRTPEERALLARAIARMRSRIIALVCASIAGAMMFFATALHIPRTSKASSLDIELLSHYLPGYTVSWQGAFLGLGYGVVFGGLIGGALAWCYNRMTMERLPA